MAIARLTTSHMMIVLLVLFSPFFPVNSFHSSQFRTILRTPSNRFDMLDINTVKDVYFQFLENNGILTDMVTVMVSNTISDTIAQLTERHSIIAVPDIILEIETNSPEIKIQEPALNLQRIGRFALFGFFDGAVSHNWFLILDQVIKGNDGLSVIFKVAADTAVFTPLWVAWFLIFMGLLEGNLLKKVSTDKIKTEYKELLYIDVGFFLPLSTVVFSVVPRDARVLVFSVANILYTSIVSVWNQAKGKELKAINE